MFEIVEIELQRQVRARHATGHRDHTTPQEFLKLLLFIGHWTFGVGRSAFSDNNRPIAITHARAAGQQGIFVGDVGVGMNRNRGNVQFTPQCALVQRLDVFQPMFESITAQVDLGFRRSRKT